MCVLVSLPQRSSTATELDSRWLRCSKPGDARCTTTFPSSSHSCALRRSTSRGSRGYYHYVYVSGRVNYTSDGGGEKRESARCKPFHPEAAVCMWVRSSDSCFVFYKSLCMCLCKCAPQVVKEYKSPPQLPPAFSGEGMGQSPNCGARTRGPPASRRHRGWRGAVSTLMKQPHTWP